MAQSRETNLTGQGEFGKKLINLLEKNTDTQHETQVTRKSETRRPMIPDSELSKASELTSPYICFRKFLLFSGISIYVAFFASL